MISVKDWKSRTSAVGRTRSPELKAVDDALEALHRNSTRNNLVALSVAIEAWAESKKQGKGSSGYAELLKGARNRSSAVQLLVADVRKGLPSLPGHWPDKDKGSTYTVDLDAQTVKLLKDMRFEATKSSVSMIAAMNVDWTAFAFDQLNSASSLAIDLGHTNYGKGWDNAQNNLSTGGTTLFGTCGKIFDLAIGKANEELVRDERVQNVLNGVGLSINITLGVLKYHLFSEGVLSKVAPLFGPIKDAVDAIGTGAVQLRLAHNSFRRVDAARPLLQDTSDAATAINAFHNLLIIETAKSVTNLVYRLLKDTAFVVTEVLTYGAMTVVQVVTAIVEVVVGFVYQLVYSIVFRKSVAQCRAWVRAGALPDNLDFRSWIANCPLLGAYFLVGLSAGGGATTALSMFGQTGSVSSTDFQTASVRLLKVRQAAAAYIKESPVKVKWTGPNGEKFSWIDSLIESDALSASVGLNITKIHHWHLSENASRGDRFKHRFYQASDKALSVGKTGWGLI